MFVCATHIRLTELKYCYIIFAMSDEAIDSIVEDAKPIAEPIFEEMSS